MITLWTLGCGSDQQRTMAPPSEDEQKAIEAWITANGLNTYGDAADTMYAGGSPLFNEATGESMDRFSYILSRHPSKPWNTSAGAQAAQQ